MKILIIGGTGTLGKALIEHYSKDTNNFIICYSRDELKQQELKKKFPKLYCVLGDIRDGINDSSRLLDGIDIVYHVAALKHIDVIEDNITEALKTNIGGTINVANWAISRKIPKFSFSSTDKAVFPINVYGHTKAIGEHYLLNMNYCQETTHFRVFRWGNVVGSRGSAIQNFKESLLTQGKVYLTHPDMSRFWIKVNEAVDFMTETTEFRPIIGEPVCIPPMKAAKVTEIVRVLAKKLGVSKYHTEIIGLRRGEKIHEFIDQTHCSETAEQFTDEELEKMMEDLL